MSKLKRQMLKVKCYQEGFIAITSAVIISILLLAITVGLGFNGFFGRLNMIDSESKERSSTLAEACGDTAILNIIKDAFYSPFNELVTVGSDSCTIISVTTLSNQKIIKTQAVINKSYTNLQMVIDSTTFAIISWQELPME